MTGSYRHLFGPVRSRRLGRSLGIDLAPFKVCSFDCCYCQVGATTTHTLERKEYVPIAEVMAEFDLWLARDGQADHLTLAGSGEPTLHSGFGKVLEGLAVRCATPRVLLSNGSLFYLPEVRAEARVASIVKGTLAAWDEASFAAVHRPQGHLRFPVFLEGLKAMRSAFHGEYWLEVFLVEGLNDSEEQVQRIAALARDIRPDRIHLNTAIRPSLVSNVHAVSHAKMSDFARLFTPVAELAWSEPQKGSAGGPAPVPGGDLDAYIDGLIRRHPCTAADIAATLGSGAAETDAALQRLIGAGKVREEQRAGSRFLVSVQGPRL